MKYILILVTSIVPLPLNAYFLPTTKETIAIPNKAVLLCGRQIRSRHSPVDPLHTQIKIITNL